MRPAAYVTVAVTAPSPPVAKFCLHWGRAKPSLRGFGPPVNMLDASLDDYHLPCYEGAQLEPLIALWCSAGTAILCAYREAPPELGMMDSTSRCELWTLAAALSRPPHSSLPLRLKSTRRVGRQAYEWH